MDSIKKLIIVPVNGINQNACNFVPVNGTNQKGTYIVHVNGINEEVHIYCAC